MNNIYNTTDKACEEGGVSDRFLVVCVADNPHKNNLEYSGESNNRRNSTELRSKFLKSEANYLFRVDVGRSLFSQIQIPIDAFEEHSPEKKIRSGEHSLQKNIPIDIMNIPEQWKLFKVSFSYKVVISSPSPIQERSERETELESGSTAAASAVIMSSRIAAQSSLILIQQSGQFTSL